MNATPPTDPEPRQKRRIIAWLDHKFYPAYALRWDDELFRSEVLDVLRPEHNLLDLGAGAGIFAQANLKGHAARVCGIDPDPRVTDNPHLDDAKVGYAENIPYPNESFDVVIAWNVLEHLKEPDLVFREAFRVLKPGGCFLAKTPNKWHYVPTIARLTPHWFHELVISRILNRDNHDTFPTLYRANTGGGVRRFAADAGFAVERITLVEGRPEYLRFSAPSYVAGLMYERLVNRIPGMERFRVVLMMRLRK